MWGILAPMLMWYVMKRQAKRMAQEEEEDFSYYEEDEEALELFVNLFDCPNCKMPAEVTHLMLIQEGSNVRRIYVAECLGDEDPFLISAEQLDQIS